MNLEDSVILNAMKWVVAMAGLLLAGVWYTVFVKIKDTAYRVIFALVAFIGIFWAFYYAQSIAGGLVLVHQIWVRVGILVTLSLFIAVGLALLRERRNG